MKKSDIPISTKKPIDLRIPFAIVLGVIILLIGFNKLTLSYKDRKRIKKINSIMDFIHSIAYFIQCNTSSLNHIHTAVIAIHRDMCNLVGNSQ